MYNRRGKYIKIKKENNEIFNNFYNLYINLYIYNLINNNLINLYNLYVIKKNIFC